MADFSGLGVDFNHIKTTLPGFTILADPLQGSLPQTILLGRCYSFTRTGKPVVFPEFNLYKSHAIAFLRNQVDLTERASVSGIQNGIAMGAEELRRHCFAGLATHITVHLPALA